VSGSGYRSLRVYSLSVGLAAELFQVTRSLPPPAWPVARQVVRAAASIVLNIAEGGGESAPKEKARFYRMARRSAAETCAGVDLLSAMRLVPDTLAEAAVSSLAEIAAMLTVMVKSHEARAAATRGSDTRQPRPRPEPA
jgi:four helix bundle protein